MADIAKFKANDAKVKAIIAGEQPTTTTTSTTTETTTVVPEVEEPETH